MLNLILFGNITKLTLSAIIFLIILVVSYVIQYSSYKRQKKKVKTLNHIFVWIVSIIFSVFIFMICIVSFDGMKSEVYEDVAIEKYELCSYKEYAQGMNEDVYVIKDSLNVGSDSYVLIKTEHGAKPQVVTPRNTEDVIINIIDNTKPTYVVYSRKYRNIYTSKTYIQHVINIPRNTLKIK